MTFWNRQNYRDTKQMSGCQGLETGEETDHRGTFEVVEIVYYSVDSEYIIVSISIEL